MASASRVLILAALLVAVMVGASASSLCNTGCISCKDEVCQACGDGYFLYTKGGWCLKCSTPHCAACNSNGVCVSCTAPYTLRTWYNLANGQPSTSECNGASSMLSISAAVAAAVAALLYAVVA